MKTTTRKALALILIIGLLIVLLPLSAWADEINDTRKLATMDKMWAMLDEAEGDSIETHGKKGGSRTVEDMLEAARNNPYVDQSSFGDIDDNGFSFTTIDGLACCYDYRIRTAKDSNSSENCIQTVSYAARDISASSNNVLLIGPYYGSDSNFTNQYRTEAQSLAELLGGTYTLLSGTGANATTICQNFADKGIIIFDSHGSSYNGTSYLCLESSVGITAADYEDKSAMNGGDWWGIDGNFIKKHMTGTIAGSLIWMAICEGMMTDGMATPLRAAGAEVVYGYSQSVSFSGEYEYEEYFYAYMKDSHTVAESAAYMKQKVGIKDPYTTPPAYPIFVSDSDAYPSNPDSAQTVTSDWVLPLQGEYTSISPSKLTLQHDESGKLSALTSASISVKVRNYTPTAYEWSVEDDTIVQITRQKDGVVTVSAIKEGESAVRCKVYKGTEFKEVTCSVTVEEVGGVFVLTDQIVPNEEYLIAVTSGTKTYLMSNEKYSTVIGSYGYDFLRASEATKSTLGEYLGTTDSTECIYMLAGSKPITASLRWTFSAAPTASVYSFIQNAESGENVSRYDSGNYTDLTTDAPSSSALAQRWYYQNGGLWAKSASSSSQAYISLITSGTPHFQASSSTTGTANADAVSVKLYKKSTAAPVNYTITFDAGEHGTVTETERSILAGEAIGELPAVTEKRGWDFTGWFTADNTEVTAATIPTGDMPLHAEYTPHPTYSVTFDAGEHGLVTESERSILAGEAIGELPVVTAKRGWDFTGWFTADNTEVTAATVPTGDMPLHAEYTEKEYYMVSFVVGETATEVKAYAGTKLNELTPPAVAPMEGQVFVGWAVGGIVVAEDYDITAPVSFIATFAVAAQGDEMKTVTLNAGIGMVEQSVWTQTHADETLILPEPTKDGQSFRAWFDGENYYHAGAAYLPRENAELVAIWDADEACTHVYGEGYCTICGANLLGDSNCDGGITAADASAILRSIVKLEKLSTLGILNGDADAVSGISSADAAAILRFIVRLVPKLGK